MNEFGGGGGGGRSARPWNIYPSSDPAEQIPPRTTTTGESLSYYRPAEAPWKSFGATSMNAISFGFVATAILISMFLIMAILEHLFRPHLSLITSSASSSSSSSMEDDGIADVSLESGSGAKFGNQDMVMARYATGISVVMAGQKYPTCIAQPAPLLPFTRERIQWPAHHNTFAFS